jgi:hypothetical protein
MPTISMFYGILISLLYEDNDRHHLPHFHARYQSFKASIAIEDVRVLAGNLPRDSLSWFRPGLSYIAMNWLPTGNSRSMAKNHFALHLFNRPFLWKNCSMLSRWPWLRIIV